MLSRRVCLKRVVLHRRDRVSHRQRLSRIVDSLRRHLFRRRSVRFLSTLVSFSLTCDAAMHRISSWSTSRCLSAPPSTRRRSSTSPISFKSLSTRAAMPFILVRFSSFCASFDERLRTHKRKRLRIHVRERRLCRRLRQGRHHLHWPTSAVSQTYDHYLARTGADAFSCRHRDWQQDRGQGVCRGHEVAEQAALRAWLCARRRRCARPRSSGRRSLCVLSIDDDCTAMTLLRSRSRRPGSCATHRTELRLARHAAAHQGCRRRWRQRSFLFMFLCQSQKKIEPSPSPQACASWNSR